MQCQEFLLFSKHHKLRDQKKNFDHFFFLVLYHNDTWMIPKLIDSVCNLVIIGDEIIIITMISRYFQVWNNIDEKLVKNFCYSLIFCNYFFWSYFLLTFLGDNFFFDKRYFRFCFYFIIKKWFYLLPKGFVICDVTRINITSQKFFFSLLIKLTPRLRCLLICLSINVTFYV